MRWFKRISQHRGYHWLQLCMPLYTNYMPTYIRTRLQICQKVSKVRQMYLATKQRDFRSTAFPTRSQLIYRFMIHSRSTWLIQKPQDAYNTGAASHIHRSCWQNITITFEYTSVWTWVSSLLCSYKPEGASSRISTLTIQARLQILNLAIIHSDGLAGSLPRPLFYLQLRVQTMMKRVKCVKLQKRISLFFSD